MAEASTFRTIVPAVALLAVALILLPAITAEASCSTGNRVDHRDAECLSASWKNRGVLKKSPYHVRNMCPEYGKVVAKVDLKSAMDRTLHLNDGSQRDGTTIHRIRGISCCSDIGELCNRSDVVTDAGCVAQFNRVSSAAWTCVDETASAAISGENYNCTVTARCEGRHDPVFHQYRTTSITVPWLDLGDVNNCYGNLRRGPCTTPQPDASWLSVSDASAEEAEGASLNFTVTLSQALSEMVTVNYRTSDGTARAGSDYRATSGWLYFGPGQTEKTVTVPVLDDELDEGSETLTLTVWNRSPQHMSVADPTGTGTIFNTDRMPTAWIARFGRTVGEQVLDAVDARMRAKPAPGGEARLAGQRIGLGPPFEAGPGGDETSGRARTWEWEVRAPRAARDPADRLNGGADPAPQGFASRPRSPGYGQMAAERDLLPGSSFSLTAETGGRGFVSIWGRGAVTRFSGRAPATAQAGSDLPVDGEVASGLLGADWTRGRWTTGLMVSHSLGKGGYGSAGGPGSGSGTDGTVTSTLTGVWPWVRLALGERLSVWGVAGYGEGSLTLDPGDAEGARTGAVRTGLDLTMMAVGLRGVLVQPPETGGIELAVRTDAMGVRTRSAAVRGSSGNLAAATAEVTRLRLGLEGSRPFRLGDGSVLTPSVEIGMRRDGGDAETGFGADIVAGVAWSDPKRGLGAALRGRGLLTHEAKGFQQRGLAGSFSWNPVAGDRGPRLSLTQTLGVPAQGVVEAPLGRTALAGRPPNDPGNAPRQRRLEARFGYGFAAFGDCFTSTPEIAVGLSDAGRDYSLGWRLARGPGSRSGAGGGGPDGSALELAVEARRLESTANRRMPPEHALGLRVISRF